MKEFWRHIIDCFLGWIIAFLTALLLINFEDWTAKVFIITLLGALLPALIKLQQYNSKKMGKRGCSTINTMFF